MTQSDVRPHQCCSFFYHNKERFVKVSQVDRYTFKGYDFLAEGWRNFNYKEVKDLKISLDEISNAIELPSAY